MQIRRFFLISVLTALALTLGACASNPEPAPQSKLAAIGVENNWVKASEFSDKVGGMTGVFADITNNTDTPIRLIGGESSFASMVEVHEVVDGNMRMRDGGIEIAPGETVSLEPGGLHVMLMGLSKKIAPGIEVDLKLTFSGDFGDQDTSTITLENMLAKESAAGEENYSPMPMPAK
jgi:copper(I)-binding protein